MDSGINSLFRVGFHRFTDDGKANALEEAAEANTKKAADSNIVKELASKQKDSSE